MVIIFRFVFIFLALRDSFAYAHKVSEINGNKRMAAGENVVSSQKDLIAVDTMKMMLRGRKMMMDRELRKKTLEKPKDTKGEEDQASKISGNDAFKRTITNLKGHSIDHDSKPCEQTSEDESQRLLDQATDEIVNLMRKDYFKGAVKPRPKPPINNHEPTD